MPTATRNIRSVLNETFPLANLLRYFALYAGLANRGWRPHLSMEPTEESNGRLEYYHTGLG